MPQFVIAICLAIVLTACGANTSTNSGGTSGGTQPTPAQQASAKLYPNRPDSQPKDQERRIGESATVGGITATVSSAGYKAKLSDFEDKGYLQVALTIKNDDKKTHSYNTFDWKLQTPQGQVIDPGFTTNQSLGSGDLVAGGSTSGNIVFEVGQTNGAFYIIYKPGILDASRGIWQATI